MVSAWLLLAAFAVGLLVGVCVPWACIVLLDAMAFRDHGRRIREQNERLTESIARGSRQVWPPPKI